MAYTTTEAAERIGVSRDAIHKAIKRGRLLAYKRGWSYFVEGEELTRWNDIRRKRMG